MRNRTSLRHAQLGKNGIALLYSAPSPRRLPGPGAIARPLARPKPRATAASRRRRTLTVLFGALGASALVAMATESAAAWWVVMALLPVVCAYLAVLFRTRRLMAEREINVAFFGAPARAETSMEELFAGRPDHSARELKAASGGRY